MSAEQILELSIEKNNLAINSFIISFILIAIIVILLLLFIRKRKKQLWSKAVINYLAPIFFILPVLLPTFVDGIDASIISNTLKKDSIEMVTLSTSGTIEDEYSKSKTSFVVINHKSFIIDNYSNISVGEKYNIEYLSNSGLIVEMKKISEW